MTSIKCCFSLAQVVDEFLVLGTQPLTVLHDNLLCLAGAHLHAVGAEGSGGAYLFAEVRVCVCVCLRACHDTQVIKGGASS